jgi:predicted RecB family endonuclease
MRWGRWHRTTGKVTGVSEGTEAMCAMATVEAATRATEGACAEAKGEATAVDTEECAKVSRCSHNTNSPRTGTKRLRTFAGANAGEEQRLGL